GKPIEQVEIEAIHQAKTAALIAAAVWMGSFLGGGNETDLKQISIYGEKIGLAFQIVDDILDETQTRQTLGKSAGKDRKSQKATCPAFYGMERSLQIVKQLTNEARQAAAVLGGRSTLLIDISEYLETRCS